MRCSSPVVSTVAAGLLAVLAGTFLGGCQTTSRVARKTWHLLPFTEPRPQAQTEAEAEAKWRGKLVFKMELSPLPVRLSDVSQIAVRISLKNVTGRFIQLHFPTTQRIEILIRDDKARLVTQWSEDRAYEQTPGYVGINGGERLEYSTTISTRDLQAGKTYTLLGFMPNYEEFRSEQKIVPEP